ncbi:hypothetical protein HGRIS_003950 [Hohenbuehelia grisea]|uniref:Indoleamine 2,3-dioxygenase n=1 Tax=Hohenbuehelia grisea TaxID=104357 RepID=A0ABR3JIR0_9AGAR
MDPASHFLTLSRPDVISGPPVGIPDTTTLAAHDFDVDTRTGFMPPQEPLGRLPVEWELWETCLDQAIAQKLQLGDKIGGVESEDALRSDAWRASVRSMPILPADGLNKSEIILRRAHLVLAWIMHFYVHSLPPDHEIRIPPPITLPLLRVCAQLQLPPVLTYSDTVLYNWTSNGNQSALGLPSLDSLRSQTLFTGTLSEQEFYLSSARIELRGVEALDLMQATMDEAFVGDAIAMRRITTYLERLAVVIDDLKGLLLAIKETCDPDVFFRDVRPWLRGANSATTARKWTFEGMDEDPNLRYPAELSGPSAGQSSLIHALDVFLGVDQYSHSSSHTGSSSASQSPAPATQPSFLSRMQLYMPRHHRTFLNHLMSNPRPLRDTVLTADDSSLVTSYNAAVAALKEFRNAHMIIVTLYIIAPSARFGASSESGDRQYSGPAPLKGTGGTDLVRFLKGVRDSTAGALIGQQ